MENLSFQMDDFLVIREPFTTNINWSREMTLILINLYKSNHRLVGKTFKSSKAMFEFIAQEMNRSLKLTLTWVQVSNKMKSLERAYKEVVDNNNATGRKRKDFEFESQMQEFMAKKRNVNPLILLSETNTESEQVIQVTPGAEFLDLDVADEEADLVIQEMAEDVRPTLQGESSRAPHITKQRPKRPKLQTRVDVLEQLRKDRQKYMEVKQKIWRDKVVEDKRVADAIENRNRLEERKLELFARLIDKLDK